MSETESFSQSLPDFSFIGSGEGGRPCIFCEIVAGKRDASVIYEDDVVMAFLDLRQVEHGHSLVIPKRHIRDIYSLDVETGAALMKLLQQVARATRDAFQDEGLQIWQSNEPPWQEVFHLHFHVMPRNRGDGLVRIYPLIPGTSSRQVLERQAEQVRAALKPSPERE